MPSHSWGGERPGWGLVGSICPFLWRQSSNQPQGDSRGWTWLCSWEVPAWHVAFLEKESGEAGAGTAARPPHRSPVLEKLLPFSQPCL